jgi:hypothetical protein
VSVVIDSLAEAMPLRTRLDDARVALVLAVVAGLVWGVLLPLEVAAALVY